MSLKVQGFKLIDGREMTTWMVGTKRSILELQPYMLIQSITDINGNVITINNSIFCIGVPFPNQTPVMVCGIPLLVLDNNIVVNVNGFMAKNPSYIQPTQTTIPITDTPTVSITQATDKPTTTLPTYTTGSDGIQNVLPDSKHDKGFETTSSITLEQAQKNAKQLIYINEQIALAILAIKNKNKIATATPQPTSVVKVNNDVYFMIGGVGLAFVLMKK